jgi:hypothetical protein
MEHAALAVGNLVIRIPMEDPKRRIVGIDVRECIGQGTRLGILLNRPADEDRPSRARCVVILSVTARAHHQEARRSGERAHRLAPAARRLMAAEIPLDAHRNISDGVLVHVA